MLHVLFPVLLLVALVACGASSQTASTPCAPCQQAAQAAPSSAATVAPPRSERLDGLGQLRVDVARKRIQSLRLQYDKGLASLSDLLTASRAPAFAARDSGLRGDALRRPLEDYRDAMLKLRELMRSRYQSGAVNQADLDQTESAVAEAEFWLAEANEKQ